jgi:hypothetical protein
MTPQAKTPHAQVVLILGSGPNAVAARDWPRAPFDRIVAINNAHLLRPDWDVSIFPEDFPTDRRARPRRDQRLVEAPDFVPAQNRFGGFVYAGGTMAFTAGYWVLDALRPKVMAFLGCDMVYPDKGRTHFYGTGTADPLRDDITLQSLEAKSARLAVLAAEQGCACVNLSADDSRLVFPRATPMDVGGMVPLTPDRPSLQAALSTETELGYHVPSGKYWQEADRFDADKLAAIDALWLDAFAATGRADAPKRCVA